MSKIKINYKNLVAYEKLICYSKNRKFKIGEFMKFLSYLKSFLLATGDDVISPLYDGITLIGPYAIGVVLMLSMIWGIFLGVKYAKAEDASEKANAHQVLINFIIGAVSVLVLIAIVYAIRGPLASFIDG